MTNQLLAELEMANRKINELTAESTEWESKYYDMQDNFHNANEEIDRLNNIINNFDKLIDEVKEELDKRVQGESYIYNYKGEMVTMDVGYAWEGIEFFIEELKHKLKEGNNE